MGATAAHPLDHEAIDRLQVRNLGPIEHADIRLGDITLLVGPQATGKSLILQTVHALLDIQPTIKTLANHGFNWRSREDLAQLVYGEGMGDLLQDRTAFLWDGQAVDLHGLANRARSIKGPGRRPRVFFVPAQRVLTLADGWPRPFTSFEVGAPYVVKRFSEDIRLLLEEVLLEEQGPGARLFPRPNQFKKTLRDRLDRDVFHGLPAEIDAERLRRRLVLRTPGGSPLPFMSWSAGQREFLPLMLGLQFLMPPAASSRRGKLKVAIIEEPEMGLHPLAIEGIGLALFELVRRGYRVLVSTHSAHFLEMVWAIRHLRGRQGAVEAFQGVFQVPAGDRQMQEVAEAALEADIRVYALAAGQPGASGARTTEISTLDPADMDPLVRTWGGMTSLLERAEEYVADLAG